MRGLSRGLGSGIGMRLELRLPVQGALVDGNGSGREAAVCERREPGERLLRGDGAVALRVLARIAPAAERLDGRLVRCAGGGR